MHDRTFGATDDASHPFLAVLLLLALLAWPVAAFGTVPPERERPRLPDTRAGQLFLRDDPAAAFRPAPSVDADVRIAVSGLVARAAVTQRFHNPGPGWVEGVYVFPLPQDSAVDRLRLRIGERVVEGRIEERQRAAQAYAQAREEGRRAGLVEQERPNIFTVSVANIGPDETVSVEIEYQETLRWDQGRIGLRFPLVVGPRYVPPPRRVATRDGVVVSVPVEDADRITPPVRGPNEEKGNPVSLRVEIDAGVPLGAVTSATHPIDVASAQESRAVVTLAAGAVPADRDFELSWQPREAAQPLLARFVEAGADGDYLLLTLLPPSVKADTEARLPRETIFVIDTSGSMHGASIAQAKAALKLALDRLAAEDRFNIVQFNSTASALFPRAVPAAPAALRTAHVHVNGLRAEGSTEMLPALALALDGGRDARRVRQVIFLTDGSVGNEDAVFQRILDGLGDSRLFTIGIGSAPNGHFMSRAARIGRGSFTNIQKVEEVTSRMAALFAKLESPVLTDIAVDWPQGLRVESYPQPLPDLYAGEPILLTAKLPQGALAQGALPVSLRGRLGGQTWQEQLDLAAQAEPAGGAGIGRLWARAAIAQIEETLLDRADPDAVRRAVVEIALGHGLVSKHTSLVAIDTTPARPGEAGLQRADVPLNMPQGWSHQAVFGLPQTATPATLQLLIGLALALAGIALVVIRRRVS